MIYIIHFVKNVYFDCEISHRNQSYFSVTHNFPLVWVHFESLASLDTYLNLIECEWSEFSERDGPFRICRNRDGVVVGGVRHAINDAITLYIYNRYILIITLGLIWYRVWIQLGQFLSSICPWPSLPRPPLWQKVNSLDIPLIGKIPLHNTYHSYIMQVSVILWIFF